MPAAVPPPPIPAHAPATVPGRGAPRAGAVRVATAPAAAADLAPPAAAARTLPTLGLLGDGARAAAVIRAARAIGVAAHALPAPGAPALPAPALPAAGRPFDVVTALAEDVHAGDLAAATRTAGDGASARPAPSLLAVAQDRAREKAWLDARAGHAAPWRVADSAAALAEAIEDLLAGDDAGIGLAPGCVVKPKLRRPGSPRPLHAAAPADAAAIWEALGGAPCVVERALAIETELVALVARTPRGALAVHPVAQTVREGTHPVAHLLPAPVHPSVARKAQRTATFYAGKLAVEGLLAVELFVLADGRMVVNELVPCPHPAFDAAELACETGQHEQLVRAVCDLPLGPTDVVSPAAAVPVPALGRGDVRPGTLPAGMAAVLHGASAPDASVGSPSADGARVLLVATASTTDAALERARAEARRLARQAPARRPGEPGFLPGTPWHHRFAEG